MFTVDRIENSIVVLENNKTKEITNININIFPKNIKEGDIIFYKDNEYIINKTNTENKKTEIRNKFNSLKKIKRE